MNISTRYRNMLLIIVLFTLLSGCSGFRMTHESVVENAPYYHGNPKKTGLTGVLIGHLPVILDRRTDNPKYAQLWQPLLRDMNGFLDNQDWSDPVKGVNLPVKEAPDIFLGNADMFGAPVSGSSYGDEEGDDEIAPMVLYRMDASKAWKEKLLTRMNEADVDAVLFISVGISEYLIRQKDWKGRKELAVGTGYRKSVKWLTALEDPIDVIHVTGALMDKAGKIHRIGAEGIFTAEPASFLQSIIGMRKTISAETVKSLKDTYRRNDLGGKPLAYRAALQNLIAQLTERRDLILD